MPTRYETVCHPLYLSVAGGLNMPPLIFGALGFATWCQSFSSWMIGNACLTGLNMVAALYSVYTIRRTAHPEEITEQQQEAEREAAVLRGDRESEDSGGEDVDKDEEDTDSNNASSCDDDEGSTDHADRTSSSDNNNSSSSKGCFSRLVSLKTISSDRIRHLICYNGVFTTYSILFFFWIFWLSDGTQQLRQVETFPEDEMEGCEDFHEHYVYVSLVCGYSYFAFVMIAVFVSLCTCQ